MINIIWTISQDCSIYLILFFSLREILYAIWVTSWPGFNYRLQWCSIIVNISYSCIRMTMLWDICAEGLLRRGTFAPRSLPARGWQFWHLSLIKLIRASGPGSAGWSHYLVDTGAVSEMKYNYWACTYKLNRTYHIAKLVVKEILHHSLKDGPFWISTAANISIKLFGFFNKSSLTIHLAAFRPCHPNTAIANIYFIYIYIYNSR